MALDGPCGAKNQCQVSKLLSRLISACAGTGTFGRVKLARGLSDGQFYALKVLRKEQLLRLKQVQHVLNERRLLAAVDHPNIVKM